MKNLTFSKKSMSVAALALLAVFSLAGCGGGGGGGSTPVNVGATTLDIGKVEPLDLAKVATDPQTGQQVVNDQILIIFKDTVSEDTAKAKITSINGEIVGYIAGMNDYQVRIKGDPTLDQLKTLVTQLNSDPDVEAASLNIVHEINRVPDSGNDPKWGDVWDESSPGGQNWGLEAIYAPSAWEYNSYMSTVKVGIVDGGFNIDHEDLKIPLNNVYGANSQYYAIESDAPTDTDGNDILDYIDNNDHGTHVAGTIGALSNNPVGITGILWKKDLYLYRTDYQEYDIKYGMLWNLEKGAKVINLSIGMYVKKKLGRDPSDGGTPEIDTDDEKNYIEQPRRYWTAFMRNLVAKYDFLVVQGAGNEGIDAKWSGLFNSIDDSDLRKRIVTVGAMEIDFFDWWPGHQQFTMAGTPFGWTTNYGPSVDIVAPGQEIYSTLYDGGYGEKSGTSMASPHVAGVAGLIWATNPILTATQVKEIVVGTADRPITHSDGLRYKILNAKAAVERALSEQATQPIQQPPTGVLSGKVQDAVKTQDAGNLCQNSDIPIGDPCPIVVASVSVFKNGDYYASTVSMSDGSYELIIEPGTYTLTIGKDGYIPENLLVTVTEGITTYPPILLSVPSEYSGDGIVSGDVLNAFTSQGVSGLTINFRRGIDVVAGDVAGTAISDTNGFYSITLPAGNYTGEITGTGYSTGYFLVVSIGGTTTSDQNGTVTPILPEGQTRIILTWGSSPSDLDSHLTGPISGSSDRFHVYYSDKGSSTSSPYAALDVDDISSYGPETTTIYQQIDGTYRYSIHDYSNGSSTSSTALSNSSAQVTVYMGSSLVATFNVPANQEGTLWTVFEMSGDTITPINTMSYESSSSSVRAPVLRNSQPPVSHSDAPLMRNLPAKNY